MSGVLLLPCGPQFLAELLQRFLQLIALVLDLVQPDHVVRATADALNAEGITTLRGAPWTANTLAKAQRRLSAPGYTQTS